ncbi:response regulator [Zobellia galactanivorans]|uniref:Two-component system-Response regulator, receiver domain n=1 Tax=Zobellia galactanivorans (strain DSM 12802 / CCUG 47099 / CIP 106680 / NCIMB 13871 / Dsij) TaxID=63186 RepID=G0LCR4_ZOBGA|nr:MULTISPECIES: response regulator [Zobellia]MBU3025110.1 response regulator [Zobellia galactanivorans]MDO6519664.1 response regulator [Zobellia uliginosa]MDO6810529.1 response regulator [Zobellia galactanivorans]CAZ97124.1 Two-component system-Response regulator, receiver domain [Zobellia galactanivorans]
MDILLIEDDAIEVMKLQRTVKKLELKHNIIETKNGEDALEILRSGDKLPDIILLDLNMPRMNGIEFLTILKADPVLKYLPTVILTTSENRADLLECYKVGVAGYVIKPLKYEEYQSKLHKVLEYWDINQLVKG